MPGKALAVALVLLAATAASAHAQLRLNLRATPQVRVTPSPGGTQFAPNGLRTGHSLSGPSGTFSGGGAGPQHSEGGATGFTRKVIGVTKYSKPKEIVVVGSRSNAPYRANDRLRTAGPKNGGN
jgi:hypothetical protein